VCAGGNRIGRRPSRHDRFVDAGSARAGVSISTITALLAIAGFALRLWQYLTNSSLWVDEAALARNVIDRSPLGFFGPLDYAQVAPPGFLLIEKGAVGLFGNSEWSLRLFPLLCGVASILIVWRIASWILDGWAVTYAVGLFSLATPLVFFSSQVKQYSSDAAVTTAIIWAVLWLRRAPGNPRRVSLVAFLGAAAMWISQPAIFVVMGAAAALTVAAVLDRRSGSTRATVIVIVAWIVSSAIAVALAIRNVSAADREYLDWFWSGGLMPRPWSVTYAIWIWERLTWLFGAFTTGLRRTNGGLGYPWSQLFVIVSVIGTFALWRKRRDIAVAVALPVVLAIIAAGLRIYPFSGRVVTFLLPLMILTVAAGTDHVLRVWLPNRALASAAVLAVMVGSPLVASLAALPPERMEHIRPVLARVAQHIQPDDEVYVYYGGSLPFHYYAERFGLARVPYVFGRCSVTDLRAYLRDVDRFRGRRRVWIIGTHARLGASELLAIFRYLDTIGRRIETIEERATSNLPSNGAYAALYDLSDRARLGAAAAETFSVPDVPIDQGFARWGCYGTQSSSRGL
jgi:Dolichyl-phosphate-mannose-protein mannosyltransferase